MRPSLRDELERAEAEAARLRRAIAAASCREAGCDMQFAGGKNCGCHDGGCSVPVYVCSRCGDSDYGDNQEAAAIRAECEVEP